jgi:hypothetical protein
MSALHPWDRVIGLSSVIKLGLHNLPVLDTVLEITMAETPISNDEDLVKR